MKILCVGDIHAKPWVVYAIAKLVKDYDRVIFLGDYVDDWGVDPEMSADALKAVFSLADTNENVILLRGNHDFSEYYGYTKREFVCSGFNIGTHNLCQQLFRDNWDKMLTCYIAYGGEDDSQSYWISHAGITSGWFKQWDEDWWTHLSAKEKAKTSLCDTEALLSQVGSARGGRSLNPSPIWADEYELVASPKPFVNQIVGHTPTEGTLRLLAGALGCTVAELLGDAPEKEAPSTQEEQLLAIFRRLNGAGRIELIERALEMAALEKWTQEASVSVG